MEVRRAAEFALRHGNSIYSAFTAQCVSPSRRAIQRSLYGSQLRTYSSSTSQRAQSATVATTEKIDEEKASSKPSNPQSDSLAARDQGSSRFKDVASWMDELPRSTTANASQKTSRFSSNQAQTDGNSADDVLQGMEEHKRRERRTSGRVATEKMQMPSSFSPQRSVPTSNSRVSSMSGLGLGSAPRASNLPPLRLGPSAGRTIRVDQDRGRDLAGALISLNAQCSRNNVRGDEIRQRFHERGGLKRKRLKRERWRKKFMSGFKGMVHKVQTMKRQGW